MNRVSRIEIEETARDLTEMERGAATVEDHKTLTNAVQLLRVFHGRLSRKSARDKINPVRSATVRRAG